MRNIRVFPYLRVTPVPEKCKLRENVYNKDIYVYVK